MNIILDIFRLLSVLKQNALEMGMLPSSVLSYLIGGALVYYRLLLLILDMKIRFMTESGDPVYLLIRDMNIQFTF
jgi:hypothetical protein